MKPIYFISYEATWHRKFLFIKWDKKKLGFAEMALNDVPRLDRLTHLKNICNHIASNLKCDKVAIINFQFMRKDEVNAE